MSAHAVVPPTGRFDLQEFITAPRPVTLAGPELAQIRTVALPTPVLCALDHLHRVERATLDWLRDVLITPTHVDAEVTAFLTTWAYERYWLGDTLEHLLQAHPPVHQPRPGLGVHLARQWYERMWPAVSVLGSNAAGTVVTAAHLATGLADTLALRVMMIRLADLVPALTPLTTAVLQCTERHVDFFTGQLHRRGTKAAARVWVGAALRRWRWPGSRYADRRQVATVLRYLFGHPHARPVLARADAALAALPGAPAAAVLRTEFARFVVHGTIGRKLRVQ